MACAAAVAHRYRAGCLALYGVKIMHSEFDANRALDASSWDIGATFFNPAPVRQQKARASYSPALACFAGVCVSFVSLLLVF